MVQKDCINKFAIVICGPTASGKTRLAIELCKAFDGEIISADSIAIYRGLDIGTAKPDKFERAEVAHHMIDIVNPTDEFSVVEYYELARKVMFDILSRNKIPIICGGTGYYIDALLYDFSYGNCPKSEEFRLKCQQIIDAEGNESLYKRLQECDPETASILHPNDTMRVIRSLEIYELTGVKKSSIIDKKQPIIPFFAFSYEYPREELYNRINMRVEKMFQMGLYDEVHGLLEQGVKSSSQSMQGIGYKEVVQGILSLVEISEIKEKVKLNTRHYAKRQITWFKRLEGIKFIPAEQDLTRSVSEIKDYINGKITSGNAN